MSWHFHKPCHSNNCLLPWVRLWPWPCCGVYVLPELGSIVTWWGVSPITWVRLWRWRTISHCRNMDFLFSSTQYTLCFFSSYFTSSHGLSFCICPVIDHLKGAVTRTLLSCSGAWIVLHSHHPISTLYYDWTWVEFSTWIQKETTWTLFELTCITVEIN